MNFLRRIFRRAPAAPDASAAPADGAASTETPPAPRPRSRRRRVLRTTAISTAVFLATAGAAMAAFPTSAPVGRVVAFMFGAEYLGRNGVVMQQGDEDCGIAALQMVLERRGVPAGTLDSARAAVLERGGEGASMLELKQLAEARGVRAEGWRIGLAGLARVPLPALVHLGDHFAVVDRILPDGRVEMRDPSIGRLRVAAEDFRDIWTGATLIFPPAAAAQAAAPAAR